MAVTRADIKTAFPEFALTNGSTDTLIDQKLASAEAQLDRTIFVDSTQADEAIKLLTAHLLALSPSGINARLATKDGKSIYWPEYRRIVSGATAGFRVA